MSRMMLVAALPLGLMIALSAPAQDASTSGVPSAYTAGEFRVFTGAGEPASIDDIVAAMERYQVVFIGETHGDPTGHMLEAELLRRAYETYGAPGTNDGSPRPVALSLEFFQRDVQPILDEYLAGLIAERAFRVDSRPWPRYETDYRPLIEFSKNHELVVIAANAPRRYTNRVTMNGRESLRDLSPEALASLAPLPYGQPSAAYRDQWIQVISEVIEEEGMKCGVPIPEPAAGEEPAQPRAPVGAHDNMGNQLHSQVLWDATMAYSISEHLAQEPDALVLHMVGSFHVARGTGTPEHVESYRPGTRRMIIVLRPVDDIDTFEPAPSGEWGDFVIQTDRSRTLEAIECRADLDIASPIHQLGEPAREPMIVEHPDGTLFVSGYERANPTTEQPPKLWRSSDGGDSWQRLDIGGVTDGAKGNSDVDLAIGPDGTLFFLTMGFDRSAAEGTHVAVGVSRDLGATWEWSYLSNTRGDDRPWIGVAPDGTAHAVWNDGNGVSYAVSTDAGRTWNERPRIHARGGSSHLAVGPNGEVAVRIAPISASGRQFDPDVELVAVSADGGISWEKHVPPGTRQWSPDLADPNALPRWVEPLAWGADGALYYLWSEGEALWLARSRDQGASWSTWQVAGDSGAMFFPYLVSNTSNELAATWFSRRGDELKVHVALIELAAEGTDAAPVLRSAEPFSIDSWAALEGSRIPDAAGEYVPVIFLSDGGLAVVTPVQDHRNNRFGFSYWRFSTR